MFDCSLSSQIRDLLPLQRVPVTEKGGRVHTSAVSVAILPQADQVSLLVQCMWTAYKNKYNFKNSSREQCAQGSKILHLGTLDAYRASDQGSSALLSFKRK